MAATISLMVRRMNCFRVPFKHGLPHPVPFLQLLTSTSSFTQPVACRVSRQLSTALDGTNEEELKRRIVPRYETLLQDGEFDDSIAKIYSLEYASKCEWNKLKVKTVVEQLQKAPGDTGSTPVQIGALTVRIKYLTDHMKQNKKDKNSLRSLIRLVHRRKKLLRYLRRKDFVRYHQLLSELKLRHQVEQKYKHKK